MTGSLYAGRLDVVDVADLAVVYPTDDIVVNIKFERNFLADPWVADQAFDEERL